MAGKGTILIIDDIHPYLLEQLPTIGYEVDYRPETKADELSGIIKNYTGLVVRSKTNITKDIIDVATKLKFIGRAGSGVEIIDVEYAKQKGIVCFNTPEANKDAVGEQAVGMLLSLLTNINKSYNEIRNGIWEREGNRGYELSELVVGIVGYGNTGSAFSQKLGGFGCRIIAYDKYKKGFGNSIVEEVSMETLYNDADVVSHHLPLTPETKGLINIQYLQSFKKDIYLLNLSRGGIMQTADILTALKTNKLRGVALDVLENEKLTEYSFDERQQLSNLMSYNNVLITSHIGGWTHESYYKISRSLFKKIKQL
jgi:D-3-phosphoglycerate dehydrogenase